MSDTFTIVGIFLTLVFGIPVLVTWIRKYPTELVFIKEEIINLHNKIVKNVNDLKIFYKGTQINEFIYLAKGFLLCRGKRDIIKDQIENSLRLCLPQNSRWLDYKLLKTSDDLKIDLHNEENELEFSFNLFKDKEYIYFHGLFESSNVNKLDSLIQFKHRIANVGPVKKIEASEYVKPYSKIIYYLWLCLVFLIIIVSLNNFFSIAKSNLKATYFNNGIQDSSYHHESSIVNEVIDNYNYFQLMFDFKTKEYKLDGNLTVVYTLSNIIGQYVSLFILLLLIMCFYILSNYIINYYRYKPLLLLIKQTLELGDINEQRHNGI